MDSPLGSSWLLPRGARSVEDRADDHRSPRLLVRIIGFHSAPITFATYFVCICVCIYMYLDDTTRDNAPWNNPGSHWFTTCYQPSRIVSRSLHCGSTSFELIERSSEIGKRRSKPAGLRSRSSVTRIANGTKIRVVVCHEGKGGKTRRRKERKREGALNATMDHSRCSRCCSLWLTCRWQPRESRGRFNRGTGAP